MTWREFDILLRGLSAQSVTAIKLRERKSTTPVIDDPKAGWSALKGALGVASKARPPVKARPKVSASG